jgi:sec-independent protein translocase protein TatA
METLTGVLLFSPGPTEIIVVLAIVLLLFGGRKIPELMKGLGKGMKEFKDAQKDDSEKLTEKND